MATVGVDNADGMPVSKTRDCKMEIRRGVSLFARPPQSVPDPVLPSLKVRKKAPGRSPVVSCVPIPLLGAPENKKIW